MSKNKLRLRDFILQYCIKSVLYVLVSLLMFVVSYFFSFIINGFVFFMVKISMGYNAINFSNDFTIELAVYIFLILFAIFNYFVIEDIFDKNKHNEN